MKKYSDIKEIGYKELDGISQQTLDAHYKNLYQGYVKKWQEIQDKLKLVDKTLANASFSELRELKVEESFVSNAVILHEAYFDILGGNGGRATGDIEKAIEKDFDSYEKWLENFRALGLCSRGWVVLGYDFNDGHLKNYILDSHNTYGVLGVAPILVMDMYEHAYFIDFATDKKSYIETFFKNLDWKSVDKKFKKIIEK
jgi:Fe-Mn family superoxide dismutase